MRIFVDNIEAEGTADELAAFVIGIRQDASKTSFILAGVTKAIPNNVLAVVDSEIRVGRQIHAIKELRNWVHAAYGTSEGTLKACKEWADARRDGKI